MSILFPSLIRLPIAFVLLVSLAFDANARCDDVARLDPELAKSDVTILGESHGTREIPALAKEFLCEVAATGRPVILGLEIPRDEQPRIDKFVASGGTKADVSALLEGSFWSLDPEQNLADGRSSRAMFDLIESVRVLRHEQGGSPVALIAIDPGADDYPSFLFASPPSGPTGDDGFVDRYMATTLGTAHAWCSVCKMIVLVGDAHAKRSGSDAATSRRTMVDWVRLDDRWSVNTIAVAAPGGTAWQCRGAQQKPDCKEFSFSHPYKHEPQDRFDKIVTLPGFTASPPAKSAALD